MNNSTYETTDCLILVVDDTPQNLAVLKETLAPEGYRLAFANSGERALEIAPEIVPDLILLDIMMPGMDGYETCRKLKAEEVTGHIPIIFITAKKETEDIVKGFNVGGVDFVSKPFHKEEICARVHTHLSIRLLEKKLRQEKEVAEQAKRTMNNFLNSMSHELRTPLNGVLGLSEILSNEFYGPLNEKQVGYVEQIYKSGNHLLSLINDLLDIAKIDSGKMGLDLQVMDLNDLVDSALNMTKPQFMKKHIEVTRRVNPDLTTIDGDVRKCKQVLLNLLSNAIKYSPEKGKVNVIVDREGKNIKVSVVDTGIGIKDEDQQIIFDEFQQADRVRDEAMGGTGIGLALTRRLIYMHGGEIGVASKEGEGSTFWFTLPDQNTLKEEKTADHVVERKSADKKVLEEKTILVVEDNEVNLGVLLDVLRTLDHEIRIAHNGLQAIELAQAKKPDLILMDMNMPVMNGFDATRKLREIEGFEELPIVAVTASVDNDSKHRCLKAGCTEVLPKPFQLNDLKELLKKHLV